jgi:glycosyltransferase involved in cell wall biosynthesis
LSEHRTSIVVEMDNAAFASDDRAIENITRLLGHVARPPGVAVEEVIVVYPDTSEPRGSNATAALERAVDAFAGQIDLSVVQAAGRYYELKNAGAARANSEIVVFIDSDCEPSDGWLARLIEPFDDPATIAACGHTSLRPDSFLARTFGLCWYFPPPGSPLSEMPAGFFANNVAFRADWFRANRFQPDDGFKNACVMLAERMHENGGRLVLTEARVKHEFWSGGVRGLLWRAVVGARDADRKVVRRRGRARLGRALHALRRGAVMTRTAVSRSARYGPAVGLRRWQLPLAVTVGVLFWATSTAYQLATALGLVSHRRETVPEFMSVS